MVFPIHIINRNADISRVNAADRDKGAMICLMDAVNTPDGRRRTSWFTRRPKGYNSVNSRQIAVLGMRAAYITIEKLPDKNTRAVTKQLEDVTAHLRAQRTGSVLFSENFPYRESVLREGFKEADTRALMELMAGTMAQRAAESKQSAAVFTQRLTSAALRTLTELCSSFKTVMLVCASGADACRTLGRQLGISVIFDPTAGQLKKADVVVFFDAPGYPIILKDEAVAIPAGPGALDGVSYRTAVTGVDIGPSDGTDFVIPEGFAYEPVISAALECRALAPESVRLRALRFETSRRQNATLNDLTN